jgi:hypothetical protein
MPKNAKIVLGMEGLYFLTRKITMENPFFKGLRFGLPIAIIMWAAIIWMCWEIIKAVRVW